MPFETRYPEAKATLVAGPFGLEVALSLVRQGVTFRIIGESLLLQLFD